MLIFKVTSPSVARIVNFSEYADQIKKALHFKNLSNVYAYNKHRQKKWLERKNPDFFFHELERLKSLIDQSILFKDSQGFYTYPGYISYIGIPHQVINEIEYPALKPFPWKNPLRFKPYPFQEESYKALLDAKHAHVNIATGLGKTAIIQLLVRNAGLPVIITTPSQAIFSDLFDELESCLGKGLVGAFGDGKKDLTKKVTVAINKSLSMVKEGTPAWDFLASKKLLIVDETHQFGSEDLSKTAFGLLRDVPYRMFLSATPIRNDGTQKLLDAIIGPCVFEMGLKEGIDQGYLSPLKFSIIPTITPRSDDIRDPIEAKREFFLRNDNIAQLAAKIANANWNVKQENTLILVEELQQIAALAKYLTVPFGYVHSGSGKEAQMHGLKKCNAKEEIERFNTGEIKVIIGTRSVSTGTNIFSHHTVNWMGGTSEVATLQGAVGRSTRQTGKSKYAKYHKPKHFCTIYDFNVKNKEILVKMLAKRVSYYELTGQSVVY